MQGMKYFISRGLLKDNPYEIARFLDGTAILHKTKVRQFLPSPKEVQHPFLSKFPSEAKSKSLCAMAFKIAHQKLHKGQVKPGPAMTFIRVYRGKLSEGDVIHNLRLGGSAEKVGKCHVELADNFKPVSSVNAGQVGSLSKLDF